MWVSFLSYIGSCLDAAVNTSLSCGRRNACSTLREALLRTGRFPHHPSYQSVNCIRIDVDPNSCQIARQNRTNISKIQGTHTTRIASIAASPLPPEMLQARKRHLDVDPREGDKMVTDGLGMIESGKVEHSERTIGIGMETEDQ